MDCLESHWSNSFLQLKIEDLIMDEMKNSNKSNCSLNQQQEYKRDCFP